MTLDDDYALSKNYRDCTCLSMTAGFLDLEDGTDRLSRNVGKKLSLLAA